MLWKHLYKGVEEDIENGQLAVSSSSTRSLTRQHIKLVLWLLTAIPQHDEETMTVHVPLMAARILRGVVS